MSESGSGSDVSRLTERKSGTPLPPSRIPGAAQPAHGHTPQTSSSKIPTTQFNAAALGGVGLGGQKSMKRTTSGPSSLGSLAHLHRPPTPPYSSHISSAGGSSIGIGTTRQPSSPSCQPSSPSGSFTHKLNLHIGSHLHPPSSPSRGMASPSSTREHLGGILAGRSTSGSMLPHAAPSSPRLLGIPKAVGQFPQVLQVHSTHDQLSSGDGIACMRDDVHADDKSTVSGYSSAPGRPPVADGGASNSSKASNSSINVSVRLRPLSEKERRRGDHELWGIDESFNIGYYAGKEHTFVPKYKYDQVFGPSSHNYEVFNAIARPLVEPSLNGINGTIFAYGVTSSGKTHTMMGDVEAAMGHTSNGGGIGSGAGTGQPGIVPQTIKELFDQANAAEGRVFKIRLSMMEIYNEVLNDLLDPSRTNLKVREDSHHGVAVDGLSEEVVATAEQALTWILSGEANRQTSCTAYNEDSSRSHTICRLLIEVQEGSGPKGTKKTRSVLSLIDLAGSESAKVSLSKGQRMEGSFINKSLLTLGTVINKLAEGHATHIPFRDSKLTRLLQNSLSGKGAQIALICNITPASAQGEETQNTLKFATRAKLVRVTVCRNEVVDDKAMLRRFATENRELRCQLKLLQDSMEANQTDVTGDTDLEGLTSVSEEGNNREGRPPTPGSELEQLRSRLDAERQAHIRCKQEKALLEVRLRGLVRHLLEKRASLAAAAEAVANVSKRGSLASAAEAEVNVSKRASLAGLQEAESNVSKRASIASASEDEANVSKRASLATAAEAESNMSKRTSLASAAEAEVNMSKRSSLAGQQEAEANVAKRTSIASAAEAEAHASKRVSLAGQQEGQEHKDGSDGATEEGALAPALATHGSASSDQELSTLSPALLQPMPEPPSAVPLQEPPTATRLSLLVDFSPTATDVAALDLGDALVGAGGGGAEEEEDDDYGSDSGVEALILAMREDMMIDVQSFEDLSLGIDPIHTQLVGSEGGAQDLAGPDVGQATANSNVYHPRSPSSSSLDDDNDNKDLEIQVLLADREVLQDQIVTVELVNEQLAAENEELLQRGKEYRMEREKTLRILHVLESDMLELRKMKNQNQITLDTLRHENEALKDSLGAASVVPPSHHPTTGDTANGGPYTAEDFNQELGLPLASLLEGFQGEADGLASALLDLRRAGSSGGMGSVRSSNGGGGMNPALLRQRLEAVQNHVASLVSAVVVRNEQLSAKLACATGRQV